VPRTDHDDLDLLKSAGAEAARIALTYFRREPQVWLKDGGSPVSEADIAVDTRLASILRAARPDYGWLSEETGDDAERLDRARVFVIDPIDGTRGFLEGSTEWTVSLAVVENGRPVAAVLVGPALSVTYSAVRGAGAFRDGKRLQASATTDIGGARFASPRRYARAIERETGIPTPSRFVSSLAHRIALVAAGEIDVAIARPDARDWDLAAADLLVQEAGARLTDMNGGDLRYNRAETAHPTLIATTPELFGQVADLVRTIHGQYQAGAPGQQDGGDERRDGETRTAAPSSGVWRGT